MKKIKEKPTLSECIKEKAVSTPRELLRKGLDDGSERLRTQLRDTAQHGQADEYGGDTIEDTAARGLRRAEKELTRQRKKKPQEQPPKGGAPAADATEQKPSAIKGKDTTSAGRSRRALRSVDGSRRARTQRKRPPRSRQKIPISAHRQRHRSQWQRNRSGRGREYSWRNAGAKLPDGRQSKSEPYRAAESRRHKPYIQTGAAAPCQTECVRSRYRTSKNGLKPACPNQRGKSTCRWSVTSSLFRRVLRR